MPSPTSRIDLKKALHTFTLSTTVPVFSKSPSISNRTPSPQTNFPPSNQFVSSNLLPSVSGKHRATSSTPTKLAAKNTKYVRGPILCAPTGQTSVTITIPIAPTDAAKLRLRTRRRWEIFQRRRLGMRDQNQGNGRGCRQI